MLVVTKSGMQKARTFTQWSMNYADKQMLKNEREIPTQVIRISEIDSGLDKFQPKEHPMIISSKLQLHVLMMT